MYSSFNTIESQIGNIISLTYVGHNIDQQLRLLQQTLLKMHHYSTGALMQAILQGSSLRTSRKKKQFSRRNDTNRKSSVLKQERSGDTTHKSFSYFNLRKEIFWKTTLYEKKIW